MRAQLGTIARGIPRSGPFSWPIKVPKFAMISAIENCATAAHSGSIGRRFRDANLSETYLSDAFGAGSSSACRLCQN